ncbi:stage V sporulation protein B [Paenibacillus medicaginis]|uniref:Stage V sporulation protein B n=1 Tax=Paenibacillus medicaginis TaxID=1470560 RepID=A0ABV5C3Q6_9BACL
MRKQTFIQGAIILLAAGIINRLLGFVPRIMLPRIIGPEGVGLYQQGYPFFIVIITLITGGIPLAVAKLVAEAETEGRPERSSRILYTSLEFTVALGMIFLILCLVFAPWITNHILTDNRVYHTFVSMTPMIVIVAVSSVYRGYFQGKQNMIPSAASSIAETVIRIICVIWFSYLLLPKGIEFAAAGAMLGAMVGELIGMFVLLWQYVRHHKDPPKDIQPKGSLSGKVKILRPLLSLSIPVTASRLVGSISYLLESIVLMRSLAAAGIATAVATAQYGVLQGMIIPVLLLPGALTTSLAISLVPSLSEAAAGGNWTVVHSRLNQSLRLSLVTGAPFAVLMYVLAEPVCMLLYNSTEAAGMLKLMAPFALFIYIQAPLQAALQALNRPGQALMNTAAGAIIKITLIIALASRPEYGIYGGVTAICVNSMAVTLLHGYSVSRLLGYQMKPGDWFKTVAGMLLMGGAVLYAYRHLPFSDSLWLQFISSSLSGIVLYLVFMTCTGMIVWDQLHRIPFVRRWFRT